MNDWLMMRCLERRDMMNGWLMMRSLRRGDQLEWLVLNGSRLGVRGVRGDQLEGLMFGVRSGQVLDVFLFGQRGGQDLHVGQGEHLLRLLEGNLDHGLVIREEVVMSRGRLLVSGVVVFVVCRRRLCKDICHLRL